MTTDAVADFAVGWLALVGWSVATFTALERIRPRHRVRPGARRVAIAAGLLAVDAAIAVALVGGAGLRGGSVITAWLLAELLHYAVHRAMHGVPLLWRFHRVHHDPAPLAWTTTWFVHPVDSVLNASAAVVAAWVVGGGLPTALWFVVGRRAWSIMLHANIAWPSSPLDGLIATPAFHARHHREDLAPANFAPTLPILDRLFGTFRGAGAG
jgi:sterol desaturase/sphingolipid hydroxylase (fatty acid hydroxylase superfamily)